ncbi:hypothetical protein [Bacillus sp. FJAT-27245]|uniref:hypothetical protein n=1 Tax=Bacillus sp. FJAT-27245 TaxID=1684144 RepID=UPI0006A781EB|nr:hypothetical protein [Bacillus sp. FJAT-27245]
MKKMRRVIVSFVIIMAVMFVQSGPWLIGAFAWGEWNNGPQWNGPVWNNAPQWENSTWKTAPQWVDPAWKTAPEWQDPSWKTAPEWQDSSWKTAPEWQNPGQQTGPQWQNPGGNGGTSTGQFPGGQLPGGNTTTPPGEAPGGNNVTTVTPGGSGDEGPPKTYIDSPWYKTGKVVGKSMIMGSVDEFAKTASPHFLNWPSEWQKTAANNTLKNMDWGKVAEKSFLAAVAASITGKDDGSKIALATLDSFTAVDNYKTVQGYFKTKDEIKAAWNAVKTTASAKDTLRSAQGIKNGLATTGSFFNDVSKAPSKLTTGIGGKIAPWTAGISLVLSAGEAYSNFKKGETTKGVANIGEMLMSGAVIASATGVGAPIAAGMAVAGGLLWAGAKLYQHRKAIAAFAKNPIKGIKDGAKAVMDGAGRVAKGIGNIGKAIGGWF